jgi:hypothetical protein
MLERRRQHVRKYCCFTQTTAVDAKVSRQIWTINARPTPRAEPGRRGATRMAVEVEIAHPRLTAISGDDGIGGCLTSGARCPDGHA